MNIVHVESFFHPDAGYQLNILAKYMAKKGHNVTIITGEIDKFPDFLTSFFGKDNIQKRDQEYQRKYNVKIIRIPVIWYYSGRAFLSKAFFVALKECMPDIVFAHCHDDMVGIRTINYCLKNHVPVIGDTHMAEAASKNKLKGIFRFYYRNIEAPKIINNKIPIIRTGNIDYVNKIYGIPLLQCPIVGFGSDLMLFHPDFEKKRNMRVNLGIDNDDFVVIYAGKLDEFKGGLFLAESLEETFPVNKNTIFLIIGNTIGEYGEKVRERLNNSNNNIILIPTVKYEELSDYFACSDLAIIPKQSSLTFYDYQASGLPVIAEDIDVNRTRVCCSNGFLFNPGSKASFRECITRCINMEDDEFQKLRSNSIRFVEENYDYDKKCDEYISIIMQELGKYQTANKRWNE